MKQGHLLQSTFFFWLILVSMPVFSQNTETETQREQDKGTEKTNEAPAPSGQEVEINEDNYRQFMELRDPRQRRGIMPEDAFKPGSGSQKLDDLPESSQKHLRNQLRGIISRGEEWKPGDEDGNYPYVPSEAALANSQLQKQEAEAWGELVDSYHKREAQIYENSARSRAAMASENSMNGNPSQGASGAGTSGEQGSPGQKGGKAEAGEQNQSQSQSPSDQSSQDSTAQQNTSQVTSSSSSSGVSQNAMEFLQRMANKDGQMNGDNSSQDGQEPNPQPGDGPGGPETEPNQVTQQSEADGGSSSDNPNQESSPETDAESVAGTSQNAMDFLKEQGSAGDNNADGKADQPGEENGDGEESGQTEEMVMEETTTETGLSESGQSEATASNQANEGEATGASQNALEYLMGDEQVVQPGAVQPGQAPGGNASGTSGTLNISDLINAKGVGTDPGLAPPDKLPEDQNSGGKPPDKDGDG